MTKIKGNRNILAILGIILLYILISFVYFSPQLEGKTISPGDTNRAKGMAKEINDFRDKNVESQWTNSMFGGMPAYQISTKYPGNVLAYAQKIYFNIPRPASYLILNFALFFVLLLVFEVNIWVSFIGALAYGLNLAFMVWIDAGHMTKAHTLTYMALVVAGILLAYKRKRILGSLLTAISLSWMLSANHPQITYYAGILVLIVGITYLIYAIKEKTLPSFFKTSGLLIVALLFAVGTNFARLYTTYEYGEETMRGESDLTPQDDDQTSGLDKSYILDYSYDLGEAMTAFIPRFKGGGMAEPLGDESHVYQFFAKNQGKAQAKRISENLPLYWGTQPIAGAPFYYGAVLCFLFVLGLFVLKGKDKWWIVAVVVISFLLSLGKNFAFLSHFMIDYFPAYNKFRDVKNIIVIQQFAMALMGVLAVRELYQNRQNQKELIQKLKYTWFIVGGLALVFLLLPGLAGDFRAPSDARLVQAGWPDQLMEALRADRRMVLRTDAFKTFLFVTIAAAVIWLYIKQKIKAGYALAIWAILILVDLWPVNKRYLNDDDFVSKQKAETPFVASQADQEILKDKSLDYRVLNLSVNPWADASTSYFHKSVGGYHGAKLQRYQEMIEYHLSPEMQKLGGRLQNINSQAGMGAVFQGLSAINMLNTKYVIYNPKAAPLHNPQALGNAWFVEDIQFVENADEEIEALDELDPANEAVIDQRFSDELTNVSFDSGSPSVIQLIAYQPNHLTYEANVENGTPLAVFSEIYYDKGWNAYIDGELVEHVRANYILRALPIPPGKHKVEFKFEPQSYLVGNNISLASSIILLLALAGVTIYELKKKGKNEEEATDKA